MKIVWKINLSPSFHFSPSLSSSLLIPLPITPPGISLRERMKLPFMNDQCKQMLKICNEFVRLQVSFEEYLCMKVLLLLSTGDYSMSLSSNSGLSA